jgi:hypothetical protein
MTQDLKHSNLLGNNTSFRERVRDERLEERASTQS